MKQPTLFARREPTNDSAAINHRSAEALAKCRDVVLYATREAKTPVARYPWYFSTKLQRHNEHVIHNGTHYRLKWLPDRPLSAGMQRKIILQLV